MKHIVKSPLLPDPIVAEGNPVELFVYDQLEDLMDNYVSGEIGMEEADKRIKFLVLLMPYLNQEIKRLF